MAASKARIFFVLSYVHLCSRKSPPPYELVGLQYSILTKIFWLDVRF